MGVLTSVPSAAPIMQMSTIADSVPFVFPLQSVTWYLTSAASSTWALQLLQSTAVEPTGTTFQWPIIGTSTAPYQLLVSTVDGQLAPGFITFTINQWVFGAALTTMTGGFITLTKAPPGLDWVIKRPYLLTTKAA
jgi:hypothetical protein